MADTESIRLLVADDRPGARCGRGDASVLDRLSPREQRVLSFMALGWSNAAIGDVLYLSIKTIECIVASIFVKLNLPVDAARNRRVLAANIYLRGEASSSMERVGL